MHSLGPLERLRRALGDGAAGFSEARFDMLDADVPKSSMRLPRGALGGGEEQVAIPEALQRVEQRVVGLALGLHLLGLAEARLRLGPAARLVQGVGVGRAHCHPLKRIAAAVGVGHGLLGVPHRPGHLAQRQLQLAQVAGADGGVLPILLLDVASPAQPASARGLRSAGPRRAGGRRLRSAAKLGRLP